MLKKLFLFILVVAPVTAFAQEKIAYLNAQEVMMKMPEFKDAQAKLEAKSKELEQRAKGIEEEYVQTSEKFRADTTRVTEAILIDRQTQLDQLEERYKNFVQNSQANFEKERETLMAPIQEKLVNAIKTVGDENGYTYILDRAAMLYVGHSAIDAAPKVKAKLGITE